jgi:hypothetical protein
MIITAGNYGFDKYKFLGNINDVTTDYIKAFVTSWNAGTLKRFYRSQPIPEDNGNTVSVVVGETWS